jgi:hypothetical protein
LNFQSATPALVAAGACILAACSTAGLQRAYMSLDASGARKRTTFYTDTTAIWCDAEYSSGRADLTVDMTIRATQLWSDSAKHLVPLASTVANGEVAGQQGTDNFASFQWVQLLPDGEMPATPLPYPVGDFVCDVTLDGQFVASVPFTVEFPACPVPPVVDGAPCAGWVQNGSSCPDAVGHMCTCTGASWTC